MRVDVASKQIDIKYMKQVPVMPRLGSFISLSVRVPPHNKSGRYYRDHEFQKVTINTYHNYNPLPLF